MFERDGRLADRFPPPSTWKNEAQARTLYNGTVPPDMSVLAKARGYERGFPLFLVDALPFFAYQEHGVDYVVALLKGYKDKPPAGFQLPAGGNYNEYFPGHSIAMPPPLTDGRVDYTDGTPGDGRPVRQGRRGLHDVGGRAAPRGAQAHRLPGDDLPADLRRADVLHQEEGVARRARAERRRSES